MYSENDFIHSWVFDAVKRVALNINFITALKYVIYLLNYMHHHHHHRATCTDFLDSPSPFVCIVGRSSKLHPVSVRAVVDSFYPDVQHLFFRVKGSTGKRRLWAHPYFSSSILHVLFIWFKWFYRWEVGDRIAAVLWDEVSKKKSTSRTKLANNNTYILNTLFFFNICTFTHPPNTPTKHTHRRTHARTHIYMYTR